jgi:hypothetical protein
MRTFDACDRNENLLTCMQFKFDTYMQRDDVISLSTLPLDILHHIYDFLRLRDLLTLRLLSKLWLSSLQTHRVSRINILSSLSEYTVKISTMVSCFLKICSRVKQRKFFPSWADEGPEGLLIEVCINEYITGKIRLSCLPEFYSYDGIKKMFNTINR